MTDMTDQWKQRIASMKAEDENDAWNDALDDTVWLPDEVEEQIAKILGVVDEAHEWHAARRRLRDGEVDEEAPDGVPIDGE